MHIHIHNVSLALLCDLGDTQRDIFVCQVARRPFRQFLLLPPLKVLKVPGKRAYWKIPGGRLKEILK